RRPKKSLGRGAAMQGFMTTAEVAAMLRRSVEWFYRNRRKLERRGFPSPVLANSYDPTAIQAWRLSQMPGPLRASASGGAAPAADADALTKELRANAEKLAVDQRRRRSRPVV